MMHEERLALEALRAALRAERNAWYGVVSNPGDPARLKEAGEAARCRIDAVLRWLDAAERSKTNASNSG
jgi:hypothetical protein